MTTTRVKGGRIKEIEAKIDAIHEMVQAIYEQSRQLEQELTELSTLRERVDRLARQRNFRSVRSRRVVPLTREQGEREADTVSDSNQLTTLMEQVDITKIASLLNNPLVKNLLQKVAR